MPRYEVLLHGQGVRLVDEDGVEREGGVYVWRAVKAADAAQAVALAREALLRDPVFTGELRNASVEEIAFSAEQVREKAVWARAKETSPIFYIESEEAEEGEDDTGSGSLPGTS